mgnify:FL=1
MSKYLEKFNKDGEILQNTTFGGILKYGVKLWQLTASRSFLSLKGFDTSTETNWGMDGCTPCGRDIGLRPSLPECIVRRTGKETGQ